MHFCLIYNLTKMNWMNFPNFFGRYHERHPHVSRDDARRKYEFAVRSMFGTFLHDNTLLVDMMKRIEDVVQDEKQTWTASTRTKYKNAKKQKREVVVSNDILKSPRFPKGREVVAIYPDKLEECVLPEWMHTILSQFPEAENNTYEPVWFEPKHSRYIFGVCEVKENAMNHVLNILSRYSVFRGLCPEFLNFHTFEKADFMTWIQDKKNPYKPPPEEKYHEHFRRSFESRTANGLNAFFKFLIHPEIKVALAGWGEHAFFLVKVIPRKGHNVVLYLDPNGAETNVGKTKKVMDALNEVIRILRPVVNFAPVGFFTHVRDQAVEGSCGAVSLLRCLYILYKTQTTEDSFELQFINDRIPCIFAVFVSYMFQRVNVITKETTKLARGRAITDENRHNWTFDRSIGTWVRKTEPPELTSLEDVEVIPGPIVLTVPKRKISLRKAIKRIRARSKANRKK